MANVRVMHCQTLSAFSEMLLRLDEEGYVEVADSTTLKHKEFSLAFNKDRLPDGNTAYVTIILSSADNNAWLQQGMQG